MTDLHLADDLVLPLDAITETFAILARRGMGKTHSASVLAEEMIGAGLPVCILDPTGAWWGLRSSADGQSPGLPVVIFGGDHADLPLDATSGAMVAEIIKDQRFPAILDLSLLSKSNARRFVTDFAETLYRINREPLHLLIDECDLFVPQRQFAGTERLLGAMDDVVRRGRIKGLGVTLISQRPAVVNKDVLSQVGALIVLGMTGKHDIGAIDDWVSLHADPDEARTVKGSLAALKVGEAWVWSPGWLGILQRVRIRRRRTFDSSATPKAGARRVEPTEWASVDLDVLRSRLAEIGAEVEDAGTTDPKRLRTEVVRLRRELAQARSASPTPSAPRTVEVPVEVRVEVPVLDADMAERLRSLTRQMDILGVAVRAVLERYPPGGQPPTAPTLPPPTGMATPRPAPSTTPNAPTGDAAGLKAGARRMLAVAARQHPLRMTRAQLSTLAGLRVTGGTFSTYYSEVRRRGLLAERDGLVEVTPAGLAAAGLPTNPARISADELREVWRGVLKAGARVMLDRLLDAYPGTVSRTDLAEHAGLEASGGTFGTYLSTLRRNGLAEISGDQVRAADVFFLAATNH